MCGKKNGDNNSDADHSTPRPGGDDVFDSGSIDHSDSNQSIVDHLPPPPDNPEEGDNQ